MTKNISDAELQRDLMNLNIPEDKRHIPLVEWDDLEKLYGKEDIDKQKKHVEDQRESSSLQTDK